MKKLLTVMLILISTVMYAQPPNDFCSGAFPVTPDGTCYGPGIPQTTTTGSADNWIGTVGCAGNNPEVWFSFVATGTQLDINITNGTMTGNIEFVLVESTGPCTGLTLEGSLCGPSPLVGMVSNSLTIGATYYYTISNTGALGTFTTCVTNTSPPPVPGQDCTNSAVLCDNSSFSQGVFAGIGVAENIATNSCFGSNEQRSKWYTFTCGVSGTFGFDIIPSTSTNDYDFAFWNTTSGCYTAGTTLGAPLACNWSGTTGPTGINQWGNVGTTTPNPCSVAGATDCNAGGGPNAGCQPCTYDNQVSLVAGQTYTILVDNFSATNSGFNLSFGGTAIMGQPADFTTSLDATCMILTMDRTPFYTGVNSTYLWNFGDGNTSTNGALTSYTYGTTGTYTVSLTVTDAVGCVKTYSQSVNIGCIPLPIELVSFDARLNNKLNTPCVNIDWVSASEINNDYYTIGKSYDGHTWEKLIDIKGAGNSSFELSYNHKDYNVRSGVVYYRLSQTDFDGQTEIFNTVAVSISQDMHSPLVKRVNTLGQEVDEYQKGLIFEIYEDGSVKKKYITGN